MEFTYLLSNAFYVNPIWEQNGNPIFVQKTFITKDRKWMLASSLISVTFVQRTLLVSVYGYQTLKSIMVPFCGVLKEDGITNQQHLNFKQGDSVPRRAKNMREYILESNYLGTQFSKYQEEFKLMIRNFPPKYRDFLETKATLLLNSDSNFDKHKNIPLELTIEQCATWILVTFEEGGIALPSATPTLRRSVAAIDSSAIVADTKSDAPSDEILEKCIDAMRKRECWGCKSPDHTIDKCPTHCITSKLNLVNKSMVVKREPFKRDASSNNRRTKRVNAVVTNPLKPDSPTN